MPHVEQELLTLPQHLSSSYFFMRFVLLNLYLLCVVLCRSLFCLFVLFLLAIALWLLSTPLASTNSSCSSAINTLSNVLAWPVVVVILLHLEVPLHNQSVPIAYPIGKLHTISLPSSSVMYSSSANCQGEPNVFNQGLTTTCGQVYLIQLYVINVGQILTAGILVSTTIKTYLPQK